MPKTRLNLELDDKSQEDLSAIMQFYGLSSKASGIRVALANEALRVAPAPLGDGKYPRVIKMIQEAQAQERARELLEEVEGGS